MKKFSGFKINHKFIQAKKFFTRRQFLSTDFLSASIDEGKCILLKTKDGCEIRYVPRHKRDGVGIVKKLETFVIVFKKTKAYLQLKAWALSPDEGNGNWPYYLE